MGYAGSTNYWNVSQQHAACLCRMVKYYRSKHCQCSRCRHSEAHARRNRDANHISVMVRNRNHADRIARAVGFKSNNVYLASGRIHSEPSTRCNHRASADWQNGSVIPVWLYKTPHRFLVCGSDTTLAGYRQINGQSNTFIPAILWE